MIEFIKEAAGIRLKMSPAAFSMLFYWCVLYLHGHPRASPRPEPTATTGASELGLCVLSPEPLDWGLRERFKGSEPINCDLFYFVYFVYGAYYRVENAERGVSTVAVLREREPVIAADKDAPVVRELDVALAKTRGVARLIAPSGEEIELPHSVYRVLARVVHEMARGNAVRVLPVHAQLSTQEAAELLSVSRPFLIRLLEEGKIPYHKVGRHRRIVLEDLLVYKQERDEERRRTLNELARESQELGFYDE